jgi:hypothetical protein
MPVAHPNFQTLVTFSLKCQDELPQIQGKNFDALKKNSNRKNQIAPQDSHYHTVKKPSLFNVGTLVKEDSYLDS